MTAVMAMAGVMASPSKHHRDQFKIGDTSRDVEPGLTLHADRLQRVGILRTADQEVSTAADTDRRIGADAAVIAGKIAPTKPVGRRVHRPGQPGQLGDAEIQAEPMNGREIGLRPAAFALEYALQAGHRPDNEPDILA